MTEKKKEIVKQTAAVEVPGYLKSESGKGLEEVGTEDLLLPRLKLLQALSPEVVEEGVPAGEFFHSLTKKGMGNSVDIIPLYHFKSRIRWRSRDAGGGIICFSADGKSYSFNYAEEEAPSLCANCKMSNWNNKAEGKDRQPACTLYYNFVVLMLPDYQMIGLSFSKTSISAARKLITMVKYMGGNLDLFARKYTLSSKLVKKKEFTFFAADFKSKGFVTEKEYGLASKLYEGVSKRPVIIETEEESKVSKDETKEEY